MSTLGEMFVKIKGDDSDLNKTFDNIKTKSSKLGGLISQSLSVAGGIGISSGISKLADGFMTAASAGIEFNSTMEQSTAAFETLLGNADKAKTMLADLTKFAASTPFELPQLTKSAQTMLAFGVQAEKIMPNIKMLGDVAMGDAQKFESLTLSFSQVQSQGKLMGQDLLQMVGQGFNPLQIISEKTGKSMADLKDEMSKGAISAEMVSQAFVDATSKGGRFYQSMEKQSKTFAGQMSTLRDNFNMTMGKAMKPLFEWMSEKGLPILNDFVQKMGEFKINIDPATLATITSGLNEMGKGVADLVIKFTSLGEPLSGCVSELKTLLDTIAKTAGFESFAKVMQESFINIINTAKEAVEQLNKGLTGLKGDIANVTKMFKGDFSEAKQRFFGNMSEIGGGDKNKPSFGEWYNNLPDMFGAEKVMNDIENGVKNFFGFADGVRNFKGGTALVGEEGPEIVDLPRGSNVIPHAQTKKMLSNNSVYSPNLTINVTGNTINSDYDVDRIAQRMTQKLKLAGVY